MSQPTYSIASTKGYVGENFFTLHFDEALDAAHPPPTNAFVVQVNGDPATITSVSVDGVGQTVSVTIGGLSLTAGDIIEFSYEDPTAGNDVLAIQGVDGADAVTFSDSTIVDGGRPGPAPPPTPVLNAASDTGAQGDAITADATPTITGTAAANNTVHLYDSDETTVLGTTTADSAGHWSITASTLAQGDHTLTVRQVDSSDNVSPMSAGLAVHIDSVAPTIRSITPDAFGPTNTTTVVEGVLFSESVTGVDASDFTLGVTGGASASIASISGSGAAYSVTLEVAGDGTVHLDLNGADTGIADAAGNAVTSGLTGDSSTLLHSAPTIVSIVPSTTGPTSDTTVIETVTFSTAVTGVDESDFTVGQTGTASSSRLIITGGGGDSYTVEVEGVHGDGTIHLDLKASGTGIQDAAGNAIASGATGTDAIIDHTAPTIASLAADAVGPIHTPTMTETVTFSEAVTGVDASDFTVGHTGTATAHVAAFSGSGATYTVTLDQVSGDGTIHLDLNGADTGITDAAGNAIAGGATGTDVTIAEPVQPSQPVSPEPPPTSGSDGGDFPDLRSGGLAQSPHTYAGGGGADVIFGGDAGDTLQGNTGADHIVGGAGADQIHGGQGDDQLDAGAGDNLVFGDLGNDSLAGGAGSDTLQGNTGADSLTGGAGNDVVLGGQDNDRLEGGDGGDTLSGDLGHDTLQGNAGADSLAGGAGNDVLLGGQGDDRLDGGDGADTLSGDLGADTLTGGAGADVFSFAPKGGVDHVTDFNAADGDRVQLQPGAVYTLAQVGADTVIDLGHGDQLILDNVQLPSLPAGWVLS